MKNFIIKLRTIFWSLFFVFIIFLLFKGSAPFGKINYARDFNKNSYFIGGFSPDTRVKSYLDGKLEIVGAPAYFYLRVPRKFNKAVLTFRYKNLSELPIMEAGVLVDNELWRYDLKPLENKIIDSLLSNSDFKIINGQSGNILLERKKASIKYESIEDFLKNPPAMEKIAIYNYSDFKISHTLKEYKPLNKELKINYPLRGAYQFYTYLKDEDLDYEFIFSDFDKNKVGGPIDLLLFYKNKLIDSRRANNAVDGRKINFKLSGLPEGVYKIELRADDNIITKEISTKQNKLSFINKLWLANDGNKNLKIFSDSLAINAQTINPAKLQAIKIGDKNLRIENTYEQFSMKTKSGLNLIELEKDDVILSGNGVFSFNGDNLINPEIKKVDESFNENGVDYILAKYILPIQEGEWKIGRVQLDLENAYLEKRDFLDTRKYKFIISVPGLKADDNLNDKIEIKEIKINLEGTSLLDKIKNILYGK